MQTLSRRPSASWRLGRAACTSAGHCRSTRIYSTAAAVDSSRQQGELCLIAPTEQATSSLAAWLAQDVQPGDCYCLYGSVGAGKSVFSRAFIRAVSQDEGLEVPSPTYLLKNVYDEHGEPPVHHYDLYRIAGTAIELQKIGMQESLQSAVSLIEWPERLQKGLPPQYLAVRISTAVDDDCPLVESPLCTSPCTTVDESVDMDALYNDTRCRQLQLVPHGPRWQRRLQALEAALRPTPSGKRAAEHTGSCASLEGLEVSQAGQERQPA